MSTIRASTSNTREQVLIRYLLLLVSIWLSWKGIIYVLGEQAVPLEQRMFPGLSAVWEEFNFLLVSFLTAVSQSVLSFMGYNAHAIGRDVWIAHVPGVNVGNYCLGLQLMYYFIMLVIITPMKGRKKAAGLVMGIVITMLLNLVRITGLVLVSYHCPKYLFLAHDHLFNIVVFGTLLSCLYFLTRYEWKRIYQ